MRAIDANVGSPFISLFHFSTVVPEFFCCLHISAFNLSSTCLLASLITSSFQSLKSSPVNSSIKDPSPPSTLSIVLLLSTGVTLTLPSSQATLSRESSGFPQHSSSLLSWVLGQKSFVFLASLSTFAFFNENFSQKYPFAIRSDENVVKFARIIVTVVQYRCIHSFHTNITPSLGLRTHDSGPQKTFADIWSMHFQDTHWVLWQIESALCYIWTYICDQRKSRHKSKSWALSHELMFPYRAFHHI